MREPRFPMVRPGLQRHVLPLGTAFSISSDGKTERVDGDLVSGTYFQVLGFGPALGRVFTPDDDKTPGGYPIAVISYRHWQSQFAGSHDVIGN
jgi:MacB-like periplasmic core domain